jgi:hypothetical protein
MRPLSEHAIKHDDPGNPQHEADKAEKRERMKTAWEPVQTVAAQRGRIVEGLTPAPVRGFCFLMRGGSPAEVPGDAYTKAARVMERRCRVGKRVRVRDGKERKDSVRYRCGAQSMLATVPPWGWGVLKRLKDSERNFLMLGLAGKVAQRVEEISGRKAFGGGVHFDGNAPGSFFPHLHLHIPKTDQQGNPHPKRLFICCDDWTANTLRIEAHFPGLLSAGKVARAKRNLEKKGTGPVIDIEAQRVMDQELERWVQARGLWAQYQKDKAAYACWKRREEKLEPTRRLMKANLSYYSQTGVWAMAHRAMTLAAWRMIPSHLRPAIALAIRTSQHVRKASGLAVALGRKLGGPETPTIAGPK